MLMVHMDLRGQIDKDCENCCQLYMRQYRDVLAGRHMRAGACERGMRAGVHTKARWRPVLEHKVGHSGKFGKGRQQIINKQRINKQ